MEAKQLDVTEISMLDGLIAQAGIYRTSKDYIELMAFIIRLRNFAPFNALLLQIQKPGLRYAASEADWRERFGRQVNIDARPLLIMWPFCPVALVYDVADTEGEPLPVDVATAFRTKGDMSNKQISTFVDLMNKKSIQTKYVACGDGLAGSIGIEMTHHKDGKGDDFISYLVKLNKNHDPAVQFTTLMHELGHLYLGHLGQNKRLNIPKRNKLELAQREIEAESVAYLVCQRNGLKPESFKYLSQFLQSTTLPQMQIYQIMRAAGQIEQLLELGYKAKFDKPAKDTK